MSQILGYNNVAKSNETLGNWQEKIQSLHYSLAKWQSQQRLSLILHNENNTKENHIREMITKNSLSIMINNQRVIEMLIRIPSCDFYFKIN